MASFTPTSFFANSRRWSWSVGDNTSNHFADQELTSSQMGYSADVSKSSILQSYVDMDSDSDSDYESYAISSYSFPPTPPLKSVFEDWDDDSDYFSDCSDSSDSHSEFFDWDSEDTAQYITILPDSPFYAPPSLPCPTLPLFVSQFESSSVAGIPFACEAVWEGMLAKTDAQMFHEEIQKLIPRIGDGISVVVPKSEHELIESYRVLLDIVSSPSKECQNRSIPDFLTNFWNDGVQDDWGYTLQIPRVAQPLGPRATRLRLQILTAF